MRIACALAVVSVLGLVSTVEAGWGHHRRVYYGGSLPYVVAGPVMPAPVFQAPPLLPSVSWPASFVTGDMLGGYSWLDLLSVRTDSVIGSSDRARILRDLAEIRARLRLLEALRERDVEQADDRLAEIRAKLEEIRAKLP